MRRGVLQLFCGLLFAAGLAGAQAAETAESRAAIASAHPLATAAGNEVLARGGNAFDAAVAVAAVLAVVEPYSSGLGGGGFLLLHRASDRFEVMVDGRETAPAGAKPEQYFDASGKPIEGRTMEGGTAVGVPGLPAALVHVAQHYGTLPLTLTLAPAIRLARDGFPLDPRFVRIAALRESVLRKDSYAARIFLRDGRVPEAGYRLRQTDLATTLERIARDGADGFYRGPVAAALVAAVNGAGGAWTLADLENYRVVEREPVRFTYRGARITTASLPSAGGIALSQSLGMLERLQAGDAREPAGAHLAIEALRRAFLDRARHLGDSDHVAVPVTELLAPEYIDQLARSIDPNTAGASERLAADPGVRAESGNTTHFSIVDASGNRVAATLTINWIFGNGMVAGDTGVLLNNEMDDFSLRPDVPNAFRLRGGAANAMAPGKRPLSSMTPTFVEDGRGVLVIGAPGGSRIVSMVLLTILEHLRADRVDLPALVSMPRYHHQWWPDRVEVEPEGIAPDWRAALEAKGHRLQAANRRWGNMQVVFKDRRTGAASAASDPRGADVGWY